MAENKRSFVLYIDLIHTVEQLNDEKAGELFKHILRYVNDKNPASRDLIINIAFEPIKQQLKRDLIKWEGIREKRVIAGKLGGRPKQSKAKKAKGYLEKQIKAKKAVNVTVNDNVSVNVNVSLKERDTLFQKEVLSFLPTYPKEMLESFYNYWSEPNKSKTKMKFEMEKTWDLSRRLKKWESNQKLWSKNGKQTGATGTDLASIAARRYERNKHI